MKRAVYALWVYVSMKERKKESKKREVGNWSQ